MFLCDQFVYETVFDFSKHFSFHVCSDFLKATFFADLILLFASSKLSETK